MKGLKFKNEYEKEDELLKTENFNIVLISKENKKNKLGKEEVIAVKENFLALEEEKRKSS